MFISRPSDRDLRPAATIGAGRALGRKHCTRSVNAKATATAIFFEPSLPTSEAATRFVAALL
jgi:hypothetical protein